MQIKKTCQITEWSYGNDHLWLAKGFSAWPLWFDEFFNSVKKFEMKTSRLSPDWDWNEFQMSSPLVIWQIHLCSRKNYAKIVPIPKNYIVWPPTPHLVHVVIECPLKETWAEKLYHIIYLFPKVCFVHTMHAKESIWIV